MNSDVFYPTKADLAALNGRKIAVLGYGGQGRAHAQNLRDSGLTVLVAQRPGSESYRLAIEQGFSPLTLAEATDVADLLLMTLPDERMGELFKNEIAPSLRPGQTLGFTHGFAIRFGLIRPSADVNVIMVAPKGPGTLVRSAFAAGGGLTCYFAVDQDATGDAQKLALAWGAAIGGAAGGLIKTTFAAECESDLFGEQAVLCGGVIELVKAAFETLVEAGYSPESAYFEFVHELKQIVDLIYRGGLAEMRSRISRTAAYGGLTRGPRLVDERARAQMRAILDEIRSGTFAKEFIDQCSSGSTALSSLLEKERSHPCESAAQRVLSIARKALPQ